MDSIRVVWAGERQLHVRCAGVSAAVCCRALRSSAIRGVRDVVPGSRTVQITLSHRVDPDEVAAQLRAALHGIGDERGGGAGDEIDVPICSDQELAPDLESLARRAGLTADEAADLHASGCYTVRFVGFSPGFPYLDGLPGALHAPRLDTPRPRVRAGSVGIAGERTGIYPQSTPGGWLLIGATPLRLFDPMRGSPALLQPGDRVRFRRIDRTEFDRIVGERG